MGNDAGSAIAARSRPSTDNDDQQRQIKEIVFITLGDGDFTWSLDFGRYLLTRLQLRSSMNDNGTDNNSWVPQEYESVRLIVTGIDSLNEFQHKYRNYNYTLRELEQLNTKSRNDTDCRIQVEVTHEVNAIIHSSSANAKQGHVIIFHHPHLGTEDAKLHSQFLCHLFHSVNRFWMVSSGGVFYLTLANGQYERWQCHTAAQRHGMKLVQQSIFFPNPPSIVGFTSVYGHRRHQTGKSFASRTSGSTTYTFVRECDHISTTTTTNSLANTIRLPWFVPKESNDDETKSMELSSFICSLCDKQFREERSLKNHTISVHTHNKWKRTESNTANHVCSQCNDRSFDSLHALDDHILAKHNGIHSEILPDWVTRRHTTPSTNRFDESGKISTHGTCIICDATFNSTDDETDHSTLFIPSHTDTRYNVEILQCRFCHKSLREIRALQQHENVCSSRL